MNNGRRASITAAPEGGFRPKFSDCQVSGELLVSLFFSSLSKSPWPDRHSSAFIPDRTALSGKISPAPNVGLNLTCRNHRTR